MAHATLFKSRTRNRVSGGNMCACQCLCVSERNVYPLSADKQFMDDAACRAPPCANHGHLWLFQQRADKPEREYDRGE